MPIIFEGSFKYYHFRSFAKYQINCITVLIFIIYLFIYSKWCQQEQVEPTTCFYLLMQITCLNGLFVLIFIIYLFIYSKRCQQKQRKSPIVFIYLCKSLLDYMCFSFSVADLNSKILDARPPWGPKIFQFHAVFGKIWQNRMLAPPLGSWRPLLGEILDPPLVLIFIIYLFIDSKQCQQKQVEETTCFYLLMEIASWLHVVFVLIFIIYLFIYSKRCQQKQVEATTCFYLLMEILSWLHVVFVLIFSIYFFIYSKRCQQKQVEATTCFYLLMEITSCETWFSFEYSVSIYLFIQSDVNKSSWNWRPLFTYGNHFLWQMVFVLIFSIYLFIYSKRCQQKQVELTTFITCVSGVCSFFCFVCKFMAPWLLFS